MTYRGHVKGGMVIFDSPTPLPEGAEVTIELVSGPTESPDDAENPLLKMIELAGPTGIPDLATNHDHYLYGHPKLEVERLSPPFQESESIPMKYRGHVKDGVIVLDDQSALPEGMAVIISPVEIPLDIEGQPIHPAFLIGDLAIDMGVADLGKNIDHYLYGHPKVEDEQ